MIWMLDIFFLVFCFAFLVVRSPIISVMVLMVNLLFYFQLGKGILLYSKVSKKLLLNEKIKAVFGALVFTTGFASVCLYSGHTENNKQFESIWNEDLFPLFLAISALVSLLMVSLIVERKRR